MSGTALTTAKEFKQIYKLDVKVIPTAKPMIREDFPDLIYQTDTVKWKAVLRQTKECFTKGQPILIGTGSVETSELISDLLSADGIPHELLNAKPENVTRESEIIALAGQPYGVTIATNMAGRGTDIILGGNPNFTVKNRLQ
jgi:preprotein translocase subunit SecA